MQCTVQEALQPFTFSAESGLAGFMSAHFHLMGWTNLGRPKNSRRLYCCYREGRPLFGLKKKNAQNALIAYIGYPFLHICPFPTVIYKQYAVLLTSYHLHLLQLYCNNLQRVPNELSSRVHLQPVTRATETRGFLLGLQAF